MTLPYWIRTARLTFGIAGQTGVRTDGLRLSFRIERTHRSSANSAEITIYNGAKATREAAVAKHAVVSLEAGYENQTYGIFSGTVDTAEVKLERPDWIIKLQCRDGSLGMQTSSLYTTFPAGTAKLTVVQALCSALQLASIGAQETSMLAGGITAPLVVSGSVRKALDQCAADWGFWWSIQDGLVEIREPHGRGANWRLAPKLTATSGLIGSPEKTDEGWRLRTLLDGRLRPGERCQVESTTLTGVVQLKAVTHSGDTHGSDWYTEAVGVET
jgi:hypothetical protein